VSTRDELILVAERLFAVHGVDGVSLRRISAATGQRNVAAAQYHFGDKQALIQAIFDFRLAHVDVRRRALLDRVRAEDRTHDVRALVEVLVRPLAEQATLPGSHYLRFLNRMCDHQGRAVVPLSEIGPVNSAVEVGHLVLAALGPAPDQRTAQRNELAGRLIIVGLADLEHRIDAATSRTDAREPAGAAIGAPLDPDIYAAGVVDAAVAVLTAPASVRLTRDA
jgi:AcrR family transcriptional regulator